MAANTTVHVLFCEHEHPNIKITTTPNYHKQCVDVNIANKLLILNEVCGHTSEWALLWKSALYKPMCPLNGFRVL